MTLKTFEQICPNCKKNNLMVTECWNCGFPFIIWNKRKFRVRKWYEIFKDKFIFEELSK